MSADTKTALTEFAQRVTEFAEETDLVLIRYGVHVLGPPKQTLLLRRAAEALQTAIANER